MTQLISVVGALLILLAYAGLQIHVLKPSRVPYSLTNLLGATLLGYVAVKEGQIGFIILAAVWIVVSLIGLVFLAMGRAAGAERVDG